MPSSQAVLSVQDAIEQRSSVRSYRLGKLPWVSITALLAAAVRAPTAEHAEPWAFAVVQDTDLLKRVSERARLLFADEPHQALLHQGGRALDIFAKHDFNVFHDAGTLIVIGSESNAPFVSADCWLAAGTLMLAACAMGLGTCVVGSAIAALNLPETKAEMGVPADFTAVVPIVVGIPAGPTSATSRRAPCVIAWT